MTNTVLEASFGEKMSIDVGENMITLRNRTNTMSLGTIVTDSEGGMANPELHKGKVSPSGAWEITNVDNVKVVDNNREVIVYINGNGRTKHELHIANEGEEHIGISVFARTDTFNKSNTIRLRGNR